LQWHKEPIVSMCLSADGSRLATSCMQKQICLWSVGDGVLVHAFQHNRSRISVMCFSDPPHQLAVGDADGGVRILSIRGQTKVNTFEGHNSAVITIRVNLQLDMLASGSRDETCRLWSISKNTLIGVIRHFVPISHVDLDDSAEVVLTVCKNGFLRVWDLNTLNQLNHVKLFFIHPAHFRQITTISFSPRERTFLTASVDKCVRLWSLRVVMKFVLAGHTEAVSHASFSPDGKLIASCSWDGSAILWDAINGSQRFLLRPVGLPRAFLCTCWAEDGSLMAAGTEDASIYVWRSKDSRELMSKMEGHSDEVTSLSLDLESHKLLSSSKDGSITLWDTHSGDAVFSLPCCLSQVTALSLLDNDDLVVSGGDDCLLKIWSIRGK
ncbi:hypothetical protein GUITHDRAFT_60710, partial [Guillardia theta CCMP2712]